MLFVVIVLGVVPTDNRHVLAASGSQTPTSITGANCTGTGATSPCGTFYSVNGGTSCTWSASQGTCSDSGSYSATIAEPVKWTGLVNLNANVETCGPNTVTYTGSLFGVTIPAHGNGTSGAYTTNSLSMTATYACTGGAGVANANYSETGCNSGYTAGSGGCNKVATCTISSFTDSSSGGVNTLAWSTSNCTSASETFPWGSAATLSGSSSPASIVSRGTCTITAQPGSVTSSLSNCGPVPGGASSSASPSSLSLSAGGNGSSTITASPTGDHCSTGVAISAAITSPSPAGATGYSMSGMSGTATPACP